MTLKRFIDAQALVWDSVTAELRAGRKTSHWMWFVFPQLAILGRSDRALYYGIADRAEAEAYLAHDLLHDRLDGAAQLLLRHAGTDPADILGDTDAQKLRASLTLFADLPGAPKSLSLAMTSFYDDNRCPITMAALTAP